MKTTKKNIFRAIKSFDYEAISDILAKELSRNNWVDAIGVRSWCMDECNSKGIQWWGKGNENVIPTLVQMTFAKAKKC